MAWTAYLVIAQFVLLAGIMLVLYRQEVRQDATDDFISARGSIRDQQRLEDEERERLRLCELILVLPDDFPSRGDLLGSLRCPPVGDAAYDDAPDVPITAPSATAQPTAAAATSTASSATAGATRTTATAPTTATTPTGATTVTAPGPTVAPTAPTTPGTPTSSPSSPTSGDGGLLPGQLCLPLVGCVDL